MQKMPLKQVFKGIVKTKIIVPDIYKYTLTLAPIIFIKIVHCSIPTYLWYFYYNT